MSDFLESAVAAARLGGGILMERRGKGTTGVAQKRRNDFVSDVDRASERAIVDYLRGRHPDHAIVAEEGGDHAGKGDYRWIIDPLDGTTNYLHGFPCFAVSVGLWRGSEGIAGVVLDPVRDELFLAERGAGAWLGDQRLRVTEQPGLEGALLATGFPVRWPDLLPDYLRSFEEILSRSSGVRRCGSAALDLCFVASGRVDGFWEMGLSAWDVAAGAVLVNEAGGHVTDYGGGDGFLESGNVVAAGTEIHPEILSVLQRHHPTVAD